MKYNIIYFYDNKYYYLVTIFSKNLCSRLISRILNSSNIVIDTIFKYWFVYDFMLYIYIQIYIYIYFILYNIYILKHAY